MVTRKAERGIVNRVRADGSQRQHILIGVAFDVVIKGGIDVGTLLTDQRVGRTHTARPRITITATRTRCISTDVFVIQKCS